jgi:uncharacterized membrane protein YciS (DUF1049 family)
MIARWSRLATPILGVIFVALAVVSIIVGANNTPDSNWSGQRVIAFYVAHHHDQRISDLVGSIAFGFLVYWTATVRSYLRRSATAEGASTLMLVGAALFAVGFVIAFGVDFALADVPSKLAPAAAQALNVLNNDLWFLVPIGGSIFAISSGIAVLRGALLPKWLGWVAIVLGLASSSPALFFALFAMLVWILVVSVLIYLRSGAAAAPPVTAA